MKPHRFLPLLLLLAAPAQAQVACVNSFFLPADATTFDLTCASQGLPTGSVFVGNYALSLDTDADDMFFGIGFSDYTNEAFHTGNSEDGLTASVTDACSNHDSVSAFEWTGPGSCLLRRTIQVATTTDGVTVTPNNAAQQYGGIGINLHADACVSFSAGTGTTATNTFQVTHGLGSKPNFGVFGYSPAHDSTFNHGRASYGFMKDDGSITQSAVTITSEAEQTVGSLHGRIDTGAVAVITATNSGAELQSITVTANDATNTTFTANTNTLDGDLIGVLCYEPDHSVYLATIDSPDSAGADWTVAGPGFEPQFVVLVTTTMTADDTTNSDAAAAGSIGYFVTDFTTERSVSTNDEQSADTTSSFNRVNSGLFLRDDANATTYDLDTLVANSSGFTVANANITTASATTHRWLMFALGPAAAGSTGMMLRRRHN